ncbi:MAG: hypothetical protein JXB26_02275 [Candidatus Aminicenantes bacterium]|nr:hypothetical protein [Candidatus Aminicenantes bacterium]
MKFEDYLQRKKPGELRSDAISFLKCAPPSDYLSKIGGSSRDEIETKVRALNEWLRFIAGNTSISRFKWSLFSKTDEKGKELLKHRDKYILSYFSNLSEIEINPQITFEQYVDLNWGPWSYYLNHFFRWFLGRYHIRYARKILTTNFFVVQLHYLLLFFSIIFFFSVNFRLAPILYKAAGFLIMIIGVLTGASAVILKKQKHNLSFKRIFGMMVDSLSPRWAATIAIGYFFLLSVPNFLCDICENRISNSIQILGSIFFLVVTFIFIMLNINKRVEPALVFKELFCRFLDMIVIAVSYALIGLVVFRKIFILAVQRANSGYQSQPCLIQLFFMASIALTIGIIFQLIWEDKPFTEPL